MTPHHTPDWRERAELVRAIWARERKALLPLFLNRMAAYHLIEPDAPAVVFTPHRRRDTARGLYVVWIECNGVIVEGPDIAPDPAAPPRRCPACDEGAFGLGERGS